MASCSISLSSDRSATIRFNRPLSSSSCGSRFSSDGISPPYFFSSCNFNGDVRNDLVWLLPNYPYYRATLWTTQPDTSVSTATMDGCAIWPGWDSCVLGVSTIDYNGDGLTDLF